MSMFNLIASENEDSFPKLMSKLDHYEKYFSSLDPNAQEGFVDGIGAMLIGLSDISARLLFSLKANIFSFYKTLKRSEIREYSEGHLLKIKQIESQPFNLYMDIEIPVPAEMTARYMPAAEAIENLYVALDIANTVINFNKVLIRVRQGVVRDEANYGIDLIQLAQFNDAKLKKVNEAVAIHNGNFAGEKSEKNTRLFKEAYASMKEFHDVREYLIGMEHHLQDVSSVLGNMENANQTLSQVAKTLGKTDKVQTEFVKQLVISIKNVASMIDLFGTACHAQMAIEHNHVCVLETISNSQK